MSAAAGPLPRMGMPMLSGPPPISESSTCRQCDKSFNILTRRAHACGHCGYEYCPSCIADGQALMPRRSSRSGAGTGPGANGSGNGGSGSGSGQNGMGRIGAFFSDIADTLGLEDNSGGRGSGYDADKVCTQCLGMLQVTSAPIDRIRTLPIKRLKEYLAAYNIPLLGPKEKEDFVQAVVKARNPATGCLSPESESYYRRHSIPRPSSASSQGQNGRTGPSPARPPPPNYAQSPHRPPPPSGSSRPPGTNTGPPHTYRPYNSQNIYTHRPPPPRSSPAAVRPSPAAAASSRGGGGAARASPQPTRPANPAQTAPPPPPPVPTILSLVSLPKSYLSSVSIGTLKAILYENHVRVDFKQVLEKEELVNRVWELVSAERRRLERQRYEEEREAQLQAQAQARQPKASAPVDGDIKDQANGDSTSEVNVDTLAGTPPSATAVPPTDKPAPTGPMPEIERGLCVVCQDEEATLAVVDCGHLCMCAPCSDLVMATSKECPLCRTRIVTSHRLIRIYKV